MQRNIHENDNIRDKYNLNNKDNYINNYANKSTSRINENNYTGKKIVIKSQINNTSVDKTSQYSNENNNYRKIKVYQNLRNNKVTKYFSNNEQKYKETSINGPTSYGLDKVSYLKISIA